MISQAEFLKTLVSKDTDESILSAASSPDCRPTKLLENLIEAERFGLALEVSMKYGLDPSSIWKTWGLRCLKCRNFSSARDKFRHCFASSRPHSGRTSGAIGALLAEILDQLSRMEEKHLTLREEVKLIKQRRLSQRSLEGMVGTNVKTYDLKSIETKVTILNECLYYLNEYGSPTDHVKFFVKHSLWNRAVQTLMDKKALMSKEKFFINDVLLYAMSVGELNELISAFLTLDPNHNQTREYLELIYTSLSSTKRPNTLYYIQSTLEDHIGAATTQIDYIFLSKPYRNYRDLHTRLANLSTACDELKKYLEKTGRLSIPFQTTGSKLDFRCTFFHNKDNGLLGILTPDEVKRRIATIELQMVVTENFFINEVPGCVNGINLDTIASEVTWSTISEVRDINIVLKREIDKLRETRDDYTKVIVTDSNDSVPVTLFDKDQNRITFLAALVLIYFDLTCSAYFSKNGLDLADQLINDHGLDKLSVFKAAARIIIEDESCDILETSKLLLARLKDDYIAMSNKAIAAAAAAANETKEKARIKAEVIKRHGLSMHDSDSKLAQHTSVYVSNKATLGAGRPAGGSQSLRRDKSKSHHPQPLRTTTKNTSQSIPYTMAHRSSRLSPRSYYFEGKSPTPTTTTMSTLSSSAASVRKTTTISNSKHPSMNWTTSTTTTQNSNSNNDNGCNGNVSYNKKLTKNIDITNINSSNQAISPAAATFTTSAATTTIAELGANKDRELLRERANMLCDLVILDAIGNCREPDYKMELAKLLSDEAKFELYIVLGKLSNAQHLAFQIDRADYVARVVETAKCLNQDHVRTVCQLWLAKHETGDRGAGARRGSTD